MRSLARMQVDALTRMCSLTQVDAAFCDTAHMMNVEGVLKMAGNTCSKVPFIVTLYSKYTGALIFQNLCGRTPTHTTHTHMYMCCIMCVCVYTYYIVYIE
jgi:hypothetical protein